MHRNVLGVSELASDQLNSVDDAKENVQFMADRISELNDSVKKINKSMDAVITSTDEGSDASARIEEKILELKETSEKTNINIEKLSAGSVERDKYAITKCINRSSKSRRSR